MGNNQTHERSSKIWNMKFILATSTRWASVPSGARTVGTASGGIFRPTPKRGKRTSDRPLLCMLLNFSSFCTKIKFYVLHKKIGENRVTFVQNDEARSGADYISMRQTGIWKNMHPYEFLCIIRAYTGGTGGSRKSKFLSLLAPKI